MTFAAAIGLLTAASVAGTDGTWIGGDSYAASALRFFPNGGPAELPDPVVFWSEHRNWSTGNAYPAQDGAATIGIPLPPGSADRLAHVKVLMDVPSALSSLTFDNPRGVTLLDTFPSLGAYLWADGAGGITIDSRRARPEPTSGAVINFAGNSIQIPIFGTGPAVIRGPGVLTLTRGNGFVGDLRINGGVLAVTEQAGGELADDRFGLGQRVAFDGGTLRLQRGSGSAPRVLSRPIFVGIGGATISVNGAGNAGGVAWAAPLSGSGPLRLERGRLELRDDNPYGGHVRVDAAATLTVSGRLASANAVTAAGTLELNHASSLVDVDRVADSATVALHGGALTVGGGSIASYDERLGTISVSAGGVATISFLPPTPSPKLPPPVTLRVGELRRDHAGAGAFFRGDGLGGAGVKPRLFIANGAALITGGGGPAGTARQSIIPWAWAASGAGVATLSGAGSGSFVTYDPNAGLRPLNLQTEYRADLAVATSDDNVRVSGNAIVGPGGASANALLLSSPDATPNGTPPTLTGGTVAVASGAILNTVVGSTIFNPIDFGNREGVILAASTPQASAGSTRGVAIWGSIHGSGGLTRLGHGNVFLGGANAYSGPTMLAGGRTGIVDDVLPGVPGPFGADDGTITLAVGGASAAGTVGTTLVSERVGGPITVARPVRIEGVTSASIGGGAWVGGAVNGAGFVVAGPVEIVGREATVGTVGGAVRFEGEIIGAGGLRILNGSTVTVSRGNPQWSGEIEIGLDKSPTALHVAADGALGTGRLFIAGRPTIAGASAAGAAGHRVDNPVAFAWSESTAGDPITPVTFAGRLTLGGPIDFGGGVGRAIALADGAAIEFAGSASGGSMRLMATSPVAGGGTLTLSAANQFDARVLVGAPASFASDGSGPTPGGVLRIAHAGALGASGAQIDADGSTIQFDGGPDGIHVAGGGNLFIRGGGAGGTLGAINAARGHNAFAGNIALLADATIRVNAGASLRVEGALADQATPPNQPPAAILTKSGTGTLLLPRLARFDLAAGTYAAASAGALAEIRVNAGAITIEDRPGANRPDQVSVVQRLSIGAPGTLDLGDSALLVDYAAGEPSPIEPIRELLASGRITSNAAAADGRTGIAYMESGDRPGGSGAPFYDRSVDSSAVLLSYALAGDADVDGTVDLADFARVGAWFNAPGNWAKGDFDYDGTIGLADFARLAVNFNLDLSSATARATVPEPSTHLIFVIFAAITLPRRRRRFKPAGEGLHPHLLHHQPLRLVGRQV